MGRTQPVRCVNPDSNRRGIPPTLPLCLFVFGQGYGEITALQHVLRAQQSPSPKLERRDIGTDPPLTRPALQIYCIVVQGKPVEGDEFVQIVKHYKTASALRTVYLQKCSLGIRSVAPPISHAETAF